MAAFPDEDALQREGWLGTVLSSNLQEGPDVLCHLSYSHTSVRNVEELQGQEPRAPDLADLYACTTKASLCVGNLKCLDDFESLLAVPTQKHLYSKHHFMEKWLGHGFLQISCVLLLSAACFEMKVVM